MARYLGIKPVLSRPFYFLSYNSEDQVRVTDYAKALAEKGVPLWYDEGIEAGSKWEQSIAAHIGDCEAVVMFLSRKIFQKKESFVHKEFELAREYFDKRVIIVLLDQIAKRDVPPRYALWWISVTQLQCINAQDFPSADACAARIARELGIAVPAETKKIQYANGVYEGAVVNGKPNGWGRYTWANGEVYEGNWKDSKRNGRGRNKFVSGNIYEGDWIDDKRTGKGKFIWTDGDVYKGDFIDGEQSGWGKYIWTNGNIYEGEWTGGNRHGKGRFTSATGEVYEGDWKDGKRSGRGKCRFASGNIYEGDWVDNKRIGKGKFTWTDGEVYEGDFVNDTQAGKGRYIWTNGNVYEGEWAGGKRSGQGTLTSADGKVLKKGLWKDDKFVG